MKATQQLSNSATQQLSNSATQQLSNSAREENRESAGLNQLKRFFSNLCFLTCIALLANLSSFGQACQAPSEYQIIPELYPIRTVRIAFHVIHKDSPNDESHIPENATSYSWFQERIDSMNSMFSAPSLPNYSHYGRRSFDARLRTELYDVYHHANSYFHFGIDPQYYKSQVPPGIYYDAFVKNGINPKTGTYYSNFEKNNVLHIFCFGQESQGVGGSSSGDRRSIRVTGDFGTYKTNLWNGTKPQNLNDNVVHELGHNFGLPHNHINSCQNIDDEFIYACDYTLGGFKFDHQNVASNNFMSKGCNFPKRNFTFCQERRMTYRANGYVSGAYLDLNSVAYAPNNYTAVLKHTNPVTNNRIYTLNYPLQAYGDIVIENDITFIVQCELKMPKDAHIWVKPGGTLIVDGGKISTDCGDYWGGIIVLGNPNYSQTDRQGHNNALQQGLVEIKNGALIEKAKVGVVAGLPPTYGPTFSQGGGIIKAENSTFRNNETDIMFEPYVHNIWQTQAGNSTMANVSLIKDCVFETTNSWMDFSSSPKAHIRVSGVVGMRIYGNTFINRVPNNFSCQLNDLGIQASDAGFRSDNCTFSNLSYGVNCAAINLRAGIVSNSTFTNCNTGMAIVGQDYFSAQNNTFTGGSLGVLLNNCKGFEITENDFSSQSINMITNNLRSHYNEIYKNRMDNSLVGILTAANVATSNQGLLYRCNKFQANTMTRDDIWIAGGLVERWQGNCDLTHPKASTLPAGNEFSHSGNTQSGHMDMRVINYSSGLSYLNKIQYTHHNNSSNAYFKPANYTSTAITAINCFSPSDQYTCPEKYVGIYRLLSLGEELDYHKHNIKQNKDAYILEKGNYESFLLDAGNAQNVLDFIENSGNSSNDVLTFLDPISPYLSDDVLVACMERNPALNSSDLYTILEDNSPMSVELVDEIASLTSIFTQQQINDLLGLQNGISARDLAEFEYEQYKLETEQGLNELLKLYLHDTLVADTADTVSYYLELWGGLGAKETLIKYLWGQGDYTNAQSLINDLKGTQESDGIAQVLEIMNDAYLQEDPYSSLLSDTLLLDSIALDSTHTGQAAAQALMGLLTGKYYQQAMYWINEVENSGTSNQKAEGRKIPNATEAHSLVDKIKLFPNPNRGQFELKWNENNSIPNGSELLLIDINGQVVFHQQITNNHTVITLPTKLSGVFQCIISSGNEQLFRQSIIVNE